MEWCRVKDEFVRDDKLIRVQFFGRMTYNTVGSYGQIGAKMMKNGIKVELNKTMRMVVFRSEKLSVGK